jgi:hypothetical protein
MKRLLLISSVGLLALVFRASVLPQTARLIPPPTEESNRAAHTAQLARHAESHSRAKKHASAIEAVHNPALKLPLDFETNRGQASPQYAFVAHGPTYALGLSSTEIALSLHRPRGDSKANSVAAGLDSGAAQKIAPMEHSQLHLRLLGANGNSSIGGLDPKPGVSNYFIGNDPSKWQTHVPHFGRVKMNAVYPGIDLVFYGNPQQLEYDFQVSPGADPQAIRLNAGDAASTALDRDGDLILATATGDVRLKRPDAYQEIGGVRRSVPSSFRIAAANTIAFELGAYDHAHALIIDPVLTYGASFGGDDGSQAIGIDIDSAGNAYVAGNTCSADFPASSETFQIFQGNPALSACQEAFVLKLDPTGSTLLYSDFIGGTGVSTAAHIAVDSSGDAFVTGATTSTDFPLVKNIGPASTLACATVSKGFNCPDAFVFKLDPTGSSLIFSTLLGGSQSTGGFNLKVNPVTGDLVVWGDTDSADFQPVPNTLQTAFDGGTCANSIPCFNAFLVALDPTTGAYRYGTFFGSVAYTFASGLAFDATGDIYLTGSAEPPLSPSLGAITHTYQGSGTNDSGNSHIFVMRLHPNNNTLSPVYFTLIEGQADDGASGIALDATGNAYITGSTASANLPTTSGAFQTTDLYPPDVPTSCGWASAISPLLPSPCGTGFVAKLTSGGALTFLTYLGGSDQTWSEAIALDSAGNIWLTGVTSASDFPFTSDAYQPNGTNNFVDLSPFLAELSNNGSTLSFASPIAAIQGQSTDLKIDSNNNVYVTGFASGAPSTPGTYPGSVSLNSQYANPLFVQKWSPGPEPVMTVSAKSLSFDPTIIGTTSAPQTVTIANTGLGPLQLGIQTISPSPFLVTDDCGATLAPNASCTLTVSLQPFPLPPNCTVANSCAPQTQSATIIIQNNAPSGTQTVALTGTSGVGPVVAIAPRAVAFPPQIAGTSSATDTGTPGTTQFVQLSNLGDINLVLANATLGGPNAADFQLTNQCPPSLPPGFESSCQLSIVFSPAASATGTRTATLNLVDNAADSPQSIPITGTVAGASPAFYYFPNPVTFPYALIGGYAYSSQATVDVTNVSTATQVLVTGVTIAGTNAADFNVRVIIGESANETEIDFDFDPTSGPHGPRTATATLITTPPTTGLAPIPLQGVAATSSDPSINIFTSPSPMDLGSVQVGQSSQGGSTYLTIGNFGAPCAAGLVPPCGGSLVISSIVAGLSDYTVVGVTGFPAYCTTSPMTIPAQGQCGFNIVFAPTQAGARNTTLTINSNDPGGPVVIPVTGVGLALPLGDLSATALNFGYSAIGVASPPLTVNLQNTASVPLAISDVTSSANYEVASNTCSTTVAPGASCTIGVTFTPPTAGSFSGTLTVSDNDAFGGQQMVALNGIGATGPSLMILPSALNFPNQANNTTGSPQPITLTNFGDTAITFPANAFVATSSDTFVTTPQFVISSNTCGTTLAVHASCVVNLEFAPTAPTPFPSLPTTEPGTLIVVDNARFSPQRVYLSGTVVQGGSNQTMTTLMSSLNPAASGQSVTFTAAVAGTTTNTPLPTGSVTFFDGTTTLTTVTLNGSAKATFTTSSLSAGSHSITAVYGSDANYAPSTSSVLTEVVNGPATVGTTTTLIGSPNPATVGQTVTLTATVAEVGGSGVATGTVTFYDGTTSLGTGTLSSGIATYSTSSLAMGTHSITASYGGDMSNAASTSSAVTVTVTVAPAPDFSLALSPTSGTVSQGSTTTSTITITPAEGFNQSVSFACSGLPANTSCNFSPISVTPNGTGTSTSTLTIATDVKAASLGTKPLRTPGGGTSLAMLAGAGSLGLLLLRRRRKAPRLWLLQMGLVAAFVFTSAMIGCGHGASATTTTPMGTSQITVTATAGSTVHTATYSLTVQ